MILDITTLKNQIIANIYSNHNNLITGPITQKQFIDTIDSLFRLSNKVFYSSITPTNIDLHVNDLWFNTTDNSINIYNGSSFVLFSISPDLTAYVQGPASAVNNDIAVYDLATGKLIKDSGVSINNVQLKTLSYNKYWVGNVSNVAAEQDIEVSKNVISTSSTGDLIQAPLNTDYMWIGVTNIPAEIPTTKVLSGIGTFISGVCSIIDDDITINSIFTTGLKTCSGMFIRGVYNSTPNRITFTSYDIAGSVATTDTGTFGYIINV